MRFLLPFRHHRNILDVYTALVVFNRSSRDNLHKTTVNSRYFEAVGILFTSSKYPKCKLICTSGNWDLSKRIPTTMIRLEKAILIEKDYSTYARFRNNSKYPSSNMEVRLYIRCQELILQPSYVVLSEVIYFQFLVFLWIWKLKTTEASDRVVDSVVFTHILPIVYTGRHLWTK